MVADADAVVVDLLLLLLLLLLLVIATAFVVGNAGNELIGFAVDAADDAADEDDDGKIK